MSRKENGTCCQRKKKVCDVVCPFFSAIFRYRNQRIGQGRRPGPAQDDEGRRWPGLLHRGRGHRKTVICNKGKQRAGLSWTWTYHAMSLHCCLSSLPPSGPFVMGSWRTGTWWRDLWSRSSSSICGQNLKTITFFWWGQTDGQCSPKSSGVKQRF